MVRITSPEELARELYEALQKIERISLMMVGSDWAEIEEAQEIARTAIAKYEASITHPLDGQE